MAYPKLLLKKLEMLEALSAYIIAAWSAYMIAYCRINNCTGARDSSKNFKSDNVNALNEEKDEKVSQPTDVNEVDDKEEELMKLASNNEEDDKEEKVMQEHLRRAKAREIQYTYIGKKIQNELIQLLTNQVRSLIVKKVKDAKYFVVMLDCIPDASQEEQMFLIVRFVDDSTNLPTVQEHWLEFLKVDDTTGLGLTIELQKALIKIDFDIDDIRGQGYHNVSNMSRKYKAVSFFGLIQRIYTLFSSSTKRWKIFKGNVQGLTVKPLSQTRWESHVESVKTIMEQTAQIRDALLDLAESNEDPKVKSEAESLATHELQNFEFLFGMIIWYRLLHAINIVSKFLQTESMDIDHAIDLLQGLISFLEEYREIGFAIAKDKATKKASEMGIEAYPVKPTNLLNYFTLLGLGHCCIALTFRRLADTLLANVM
ncbi:52 kDa repressor of the inhibitor of the protein kinase-like [Olea europaea var. sylvestris]|uniref:52 kDa repressor of the inhibitor of the protein kinase-like n=1 Tax=Olea europaea var. sylvestris TaxID=158386 RepID=UPI000C1CD60F|nr:52 kDa repressor of the inhibitor of the protein kinase-like [Olea europaea var. sylvestris]